MAPHAAMDASDWAVARMGIVYVGKSLLFKTDMWVFQKRIKDFKSAGIFAAVSHLLCWLMNWYIFLVEARDGAVHEGHGNNASS